MNRVVRSMTGSLTFIAIPLLFMCLLLIPFLFMSMPQEASDELWRTLFERQRIVVLTVAFFTGALFSWLQLAASHPWISPDLAEWLCGAGWDGRRPIRHLAIRLHPFECLCVAVLVLLESLLSGGVSIAALIGWALTRILTLSWRPQMFMQRCLSTMITALCGLVLLTVSVPLAGAVLIVAIWLLERAHRAGLVEWAESSVMKSVDQLVATEGVPDELTHDLRRVAGSLAARKLDPRFAQPTEVTGQRPDVGAALLIAGLAAFLPVPAAFLATSIPGLAAKLPPFANLAAGASAAVSAAMIVGFVAARFRWYGMDNWCSARGYRRRLAERRLFDWEYDCCLLSFFAALLPPILLAAWKLYDDLLLEQSWNPWLVAGTFATTTFLLQRLGPDPVRWQLTSPAQMIRRSNSAAERAARVRLRRQKQRT